MNRYFWTMLVLTVSFIALVELMKVRLGESQGLGFLGGSLFGLWWGFVLSSAIDAWITSLQQKKDEARQ